MFTGCSRLVTGRSRRSNARARGSHLSMTPRVIRTPSVEKWEAGGVTGGLRYERVTNGQNSAAAGQLNDNRLPSESNSPNSQDSASAGVSLYEWLARHTRAGNLICRMCVATRDWPELRRRAPAGGRSVLTHARRQGQFSSDFARAATPRRRTLWHVARSAFCQHRSPAVSPRVVGRTTRLFRAIAARAHPGAPRMASAGSILRVAWRPSPPALGAVGGDIRVRSRVRLLD